MQVGNIALSSLPRMWDLSDMAGTSDLKGIGLYTRLIAIKPDGLAETTWAIDSGLNRGFFTNLKEKNISPRGDSIRKLLDFIGKTEADLRDPRTSNAVPVPMEGASMYRMPQDVPIHGTALGADRIVEDIAIEQTQLNTGETIGYAKRPPILDGRADAYGIYVQGSSMSPVHEDGSLVLVETKRPPRVGDDVVIYLRARGEQDMDDTDGRARCVLVKRLVRRSASYIELEQFSPALTFRIAANEISVIHRVLNMGDLLS